MSACHEWKLMNVFATRKRTATAATAFCAAALLTQCMVQTTIAAAAQAVPVLLSTIAFACYREVFEFTPFEE